MGDVISLKKKRPPKKCSCGWTMPRIVAVEFHTSPLAVSENRHRDLLVEFKCPDCSRTYRWTPNGMIVMVVE